MKPTAFKIFVVEDDEWYRRLLVHNLSLNPDYDIQTFADGKSCLDNLYQKPAVVTLDYRLPDMKGLEVLKQIREADDEIRVILISEQEDIEVVVELLKQGAYDYLVKSKDIRERLLNTINNIRKESDLRNEIKTLRKEVRKKYSYQKTIIGNSAATQKIFDLIEKATRTNVTVSVSGETGTGKELVAKAIHYNSDRAKKPFVAVNMAAIPRELIESELFGHEKGAFTGAAARRTGKFEEASSGTLFLDEIAEMDIALQAKLLRVLQEKEIIRVGSNQPVKIDCRIIIATHKNLLEEVKKGNFRQDLYYRLYGLPIEIPPLRERENDVILLAKTFVADFCETNKLAPKSLSAAAGKKLLAYNWPGNVRELRSVIELAATLADDNEIGAEHLMMNDGENLAELFTEEMTLRDYNLLIVKKLLEKYDNKAQKVADILGIGVATVYRMIRETD